MAPHLNAVEFSIVVSGLTEQLLRRLHEQSRRAEHHRECSAIHVIRYFVCALSEASLRRIFAEFHDHWREQADFTQNRVAGVMAMLEQLGELELG